MIDPIEFKRRADAARDFVRLIDRVFTLEGRTEMEIAYCKAGVLEHIVETMARTPSDSLATLETFRPFYERRLAAATEKGGA